MNTKEQIVFDIQKIKEKIKEIKLFVLNQEKVLDEINSNEEE